MKIFAEKAKKAEAVEPLREGGYGLGGTDDRIMLKSIIRRNGPTQIGEWGALWIQFLATLNKGLLTNLRVSGPAGAGDFRRLNIQSVSAGGKSAFVYFDDGIAHLTLDLSKYQIVIDEKTVIVQSGSYEQGFRLYFSLPTVVEADTDAETKKILATLYARAGGKLMY